LISAKLKERLIFIGPLIVLPGLIVAWPVLEVLWLSFRNRVQIFHIDRWVGAANYLYLFGEDLRFASAVSNTLYFTFVSVGLEFLLGLGFALYLRFSPEREWVKGMMLIPWVIPSVVSARLWQWMLHAEAGIVNYLLQSVGLTDAPIPWLSSPDLALHAAIFADVWKTTPLMVLLLYAGLLGIPENLLRAARVDRTPPFRMLFCILIPQLRPAIATAVVLRLLDAFRVFDVIYVMTGGGPANSTETLSLYAYRTYFQSLQFGYGSSVVVVQVMILAGLTAVAYRLLQGKNPAAAGDGPGEFHPRRTEVKE